MLKHSPTLLLILAGILFAGLMVVYWYSTRRELNNVEVLPEPEASSEAKVLTGQPVCLPHKDNSGPQTMECLYGILANDGNHYALDLNSIPESEANLIQTSNQVELTGKVVPLEVISTDFWYRYDIMGIMLVEKLLVLE